MSTMISTCHFVSRQHAIKYYRSQGYVDAAAAVDDKLKEQAIVIGPPETESWQSLKTNDEGRYVIVEPEFKPVKWDDVAIGDTVYIDNYQNGQFPKASPKISGPFKVVKGNGCGRCLEVTKGKAKGQTFMSYPETLIQKL